MSKSERSRVRLAIHGDDFGLQVPRPTELRLQGFRSTSCTASFSKNGPAAAMRYIGAISANRSVSGSSIAMDDIANVDIIES